MFWSACLLIGLVGGCSGGSLLRVPKVYNAIINTDTNLTPSRAFPLIQPVLHETALGYPLHAPLIYHQDPKLQLHQQQQHQPYPNHGAKPDIKTPDQDESQSSEKEPPQPPPEHDQKPQDPKKPEMPPTESPIKLNEFGLPPSLVPVNQFNHRLPSFDPYTYNPYYTDPYGNIILPYNNLYNPYYPGFPHQSPFNPYLVQTPFFNPGQPGGEQPWSDPSWSQPPTKDEDGDKQQPDKPNFPPPNLNVKNNSNKNSDIPDVPPPPLPVGGLKKDTKKPSK